MKKKKVKKVVKKKVVRKVSKPHTPSRKDFEVFAKGVERLEQLKNELYNLNTSGYEIEVASIRSKLKNVSYIPEIEKEMRVLKSKISGSYKVLKGVSNAGGVPVAGVKINKKIKELEKQIKKKRRVPKNKELNKIPKMEGQINHLKSVLDKQAEEEKRKKDLLKKIDPSVNFLVNNSFNLSLNEIKAELSKKLKSKELDVQRRLQEDLELRKNNFQLQYKDLEHKFAEKYEQNVQMHLKNEVNRRFNNVLRARINALQKKLEKESFDRFQALKNDLNAKEQEKLRQLEKERREVRKKLSIENKKKLAAEGKRLKFLLNSKEIKEVERKTRELEKQTKALRNQLEKQTRESRNRSLIDSKRLTDRKKKSMRKLIEKRKSIIRNLTEKRKSMIKRLTNQANKRLNAEKQRLKNNEKKVLIDLLKKQNSLRSLINGEKQKTIKINEKTLKISLSKNQIGDLRNKLKKEFLDNKRNTEREYGARLIKERAELERHFKDQILAHRARLNQQMHEHLTSEVGKLHKEHESKKKKENTRIEDMKKRIDSERSMLSRIRNQLNAEKRNVLADKNSYKKSLQEKLETEKQEAIKDRVKEQSVMIKAKLRKDFNEKLRMEIRAKEAEFEKRKADLAIEIQKKAKDLFV
jgi:hypothetical protein